MIRNISVGIDIGSGMTRVIVGEFLKGEKNPKIIGIGEVETQGIRHGYLIDFDKVAKSIKNAVEMAEKTSNIKIKRTFLCISGISLKSEISSGSVIVSKADGEVTNLDINKALQESEENLNLTNKKIIQSFSLSYKLDGKEILGRIEGMHGTKLEVKSIFLTYSIAHLEDLIEVIAKIGIEVIDVIASPLALAEIVLSEKQKIVGVAMVSIGNQTTSLSVFENGLPVYLQTFSIGSSDITNDIALGLKIPLEKAENLKIGNNEEDFSKKKLDEIIEARLSDIFELVENHLKKIKRSELLPAGIVFVGGGSNIKNLEEISKSILKLPTSIGSTDIFGNMKTKLRDLSWFNVLGTIMIGKNDSTYSEGSLGNLFKDFKNTIKSNIKQLMP